MQRCLQTLGADITKGDFDRIFFALLVASSFFAVERVRFIASTINWRLSCQRFYALIPIQYIITIIYACCFFSNDEKILAQNFLQLSNAYDNLFLKPT